MLLKDTRFRAAMLRLLGEGMDLRVTVWDADNMSTTVHAFDRRHWSGMGPLGFHIGRGFVRTRAYNEPFFPPTAIRKVEAYSNGVKIGTWFPAVAVLLEPGTWSLSPIPYGAAEHPFSPPPRVDFLILPGRFVKNAKGRALKLRIIDGGKKNAQPE